MSWKKISWMRHFVGNSPISDAAEREGGSGVCSYHESFLIPEYLLQNVGFGKPNSLNDE